MRALPRTCPLDASRIAGALYQGSAPPIGLTVRDCGFDVLVLAAKEYQPDDTLFPGVRVLHAPLDDANVDAYTWSVASGAASRVARALRRGGRVLVTCHMGINRSGLIVALSLHELSRQQASPIIRHIRRARPGSLRNEEFVRALRMYAG